MGGDTTQAGGLLSCTLHLPCRNTLAPRAASAAEQAARYLCVVVQPCGLQQLVCAIKRGTAVQQLVDAWRRGGLVSEAKQAGERPDKTWAFLQKARVAQLSPAEDDPQ